MLKQAGQVETETDVYANSFRHDGYAICENVASSAQVERLRVAIESIPDGKEVLKRQNIYGVRNLMEVCPAVKEIARTNLLRQFVTPLLGEGAFAVRATFFDKSPGSNWSLFWHRDTAIALEARLEAPGFVSWSRKAGVWHVRPPLDVLENMIAVRLHLDDCGPDNGPLRVMPGSHRSGYVDGPSGNQSSNSAEVVCSVGCGGVVIMCPLTLHASSPSTIASHRRVIHIEYATGELPHALRWKNRICPELNPARRA